MWRARSVGADAAFSVTLLALLCTCLSFSEAHSGHHGADFEESWWNHLVEKEENPEWSFIESLGDIDGAIGDKWSLSGNLAVYSGLTRIKSITLPIVVNLIFTGFDDFGNQLIQLSEEQFEPWFGHVDHKIRHRINAVGEEQTTTLKSVTRISPIHYGFFLNLVKTSPLFDTILQDNILWNTRMERQSGYREDKARLNPFYEEEEMEDMGGADSGVYYTDANHFSSTLLAAMESMGIGSAYNMVMMNSVSPVKSHQIYGYRSGLSQGELEELRRLNLTDFSIDPLPCSMDQLPPLPLFLLPRQLDDHVKVMDFRQASFEWANWYISSMLEEHERVQDVPAPDDPSLIFTFATSVHKSVPSLASTILSQGNGFEHEYLFKAGRKNSEVHENCLVGNWVTSKRTAFIDLTAGPLDWGPLIAGEGTRTSDSVPRVPLYEEIFSHKQESQHSLDHETSEMMDNMLNQIGLLMVEKDCLGTNANDEECLKLKASHDIIQDRLRLLVARDVLGDEFEGQGSDHRMDAFLAQAAALISQSFHHLLVPGSSLIPSPFSTHVVFQLYLVQLQNEYDPKEDFDYETFKREILKLAMPSQEFSFSFVRIAAKDVTELAAAFRLSLRTSAVPNLDVTGEFRTTYEHYVDSISLRDLLHSSNTVRFTDEDEYFGRHIPIFLFSVAEDQPILVDKYYQAKALSDMVLVVQNRQRSAPTRIQCNGKYIYTDLRDSLRPSLAAVAMSVGGLIPTHVNYNEAHESAVQHWLWSVGDNPLSHTSSGTSFNGFQIDIVQRNQVVDTLEKVVETINNSIQTMEEVKTDANNAGVLHLLPISDLQALYNSTFVQLTEAAASVSVLNFDLAIEQASTALYFASKLQLLSWEIQIAMDSYQCLPFSIEETDTNSQMMLIIPILFFIFDVLLIILVLLCRNKGKKKQKIN